MLKPFDFKARKKKNLGMTKIGPFLLDRKKYNHASVGFVYKLGEGDFNGLFLKTETTKY